MLDYHPVTIAIGDTFRELVQITGDEFERLNGIRPQVITDEDVKGIDYGVPHFIKAWLWDLVPKNVDRVLFLDADVLPVKPIDSIMDVPFAAVMDIGKKWRMHGIRILVRSDIYVNTGVFIATRETQEVFDKLKLFAASTADAWSNIYEQTILNILLQEKIGITVLPDAWNWQMYYNQRKGIEHAKFLHFFGAGFPVASNFQPLHAIAQLNRLYACPPNC